MYALNRSEQFGTVRTSAPPRRNRPRRCRAEPHVPAGESLPVITLPTSQNARRMPRSTFSQVKCLHVRQLHVSAPAPAHEHTNPTASHNTRKIAAFSACTPCASLHTLPQVYLQPARAWWHCRHAAHRTRSHAAAQAGHGAADTAPKSCSRTA